MCILIRRRGIGFWVLEERGGNEKKGKGREGKGREGKGRGKQSLTKREGKEDLDGHDALIFWKFDERYGYPSVCTVNQSASRSFRSGGNGRE